MSWIELDGLTLSYPKYTYTAIAADIFSMYPTIGLHAGLKAYAPTGAEKVYLGMTNAFLAASLHNLVANYRLQGIRQFLIMMATSLSASSNRKLSKNKISLQRK